MYRRKPTRIELKVEDLQEYDIVKKENEQKNLSICKDNEITESSESSKTRQTTINERIGYKPQPRVTN